jgi:hypothetical protein
MNQTADAAGGLLARTAMRVDRAHQNGLLPPIGAAMSSVSGMSRP